MPIHLRQICLVAGELSPAIDDLVAVLGAPRCYVDDAVAKYGLENTLLTVGTQFLEVVAPTRDGTAAGRYLDRRGGDGGYMVICQVPRKAEQDEVRANAAGAGVRVAHETDRGTWTLMQLHPRDMGAAFFEVDWDEQEDVTGNWEPAGGLGWQDTAADGPATAIVAAELQSDDPAALAAQWARVAGLPVVEVEGHPVIALANAQLRFVTAADGRGDGLGAIDVKVTDRGEILDRARARGLDTGPAQATICGTRINLV